MFFRTSAPNVFLSLFPITDCFLPSPYKLRLTAFTHRIKRQFDPVPEKSFDWYFQSFRRMKESAQSQFIPQ